MKETRIAVWGAHLSWDGGIDFLYYLVNTLTAVKKDYNLNFFLILPYDSVSELKFFVINAINSIKRGALPGYKKQGINDKIRKAFKNSDIEIVYYNYLENDLEKQLKKINADVLFPVIKKFSAKISTPWIGYIPDLQHISFSNFFSAEEKIHRDKRYTTLLNCSKVVIVNSVSVKDELKNHYAAKDNVFSLSFCPPEPQNNVRDYSLADLVIKYKLPKRYFVICNQFWKHKNHGVAFQALKLLLESKIYNGVELFCTGKMQDERFPEYIDELTNYIIENGLEKKIHLLGFISKEDQMALIDNAIALIQPTLFEGGPGGGSVYNAITLGAPCIISDIEVNREISGENITFFEATSPDDLAQKMRTLLGTPQEKSGLDDLIKEGYKRRRHLGEELVKIINIARGE